MDEYCCDICNQPQTDVDILRSGRYQGWDWQCCLRCSNKYQVFTGKEVVTLLKAMKELEKEPEEYWKG